MSRRAVFLDRDKTIIADPGYINDPDQVELLPGAAEGIRKLNDAGYLVIVASNQSAVARGIVTEERLSEIHDRLRESLGEQGARLDAIYYCPYLNGPQATVEQYRRASDLRKPRPGMLLLASRDLDISLSESWMVGDSSRDVVAGRDAGCRTIYIRDSNTGQNAEADDEAADCDPDYIVDSLNSAADCILENKDLPPLQRRAHSVDAVSADGSCAAGEPSVTALISEIRDILQRHERGGRQEDFSMARLCGTLTQMLALVAGCWGVVSLLEESDQALPRIALALFLQVLSLTAFVGNGRH